MGAKASSSWCLLLVVGVLLVAAAGSATLVVAAEEVFDKNYEVQWGADGYHLVIRGTEANITMDQSSGKFVYVAR
jgi:xyloglucan:xyloglucosyl transferase